MTDQPSLPALREAVATVTHLLPDDNEPMTQAERALDRLAAGFPALLDELEQLRADLAALRVKSARDMDIQAQELAYRLEIQADLAAAWAVPNKTDLSLLVRAERAEADLAAARAVLETAYKAGHLRGNRHIVGMAGQSEREYDWLAWQARREP